MRLVCVVCVSVDLCLLCRLGRSEAGVGVGGVDTKHRPLLRPLLQARAVVRGQSVAFKVKLSGFECCCVFCCCLFVLFMNQQARGWKRFE
jgi:hypothetical protein